MLFLLSVTYSECRDAECRDAECRYAECRYADCRYAECRYAECRGALDRSCFYLKTGGINFFNGTHTFE